MRAYPAAVTAILGDGTRLADLGPGSPDLAKKPLLLTFDPFRDLGPVKDPAIAKLCLAGLWLYHDFIDESHTISQEIDRIFPYTYGIRESSTNAESQGFFLSSIL